MNRAFASLYLIIVLAILLLGVVLNKFWDEVNPPVDVDPAVIDLISLLETSLLETSAIANSDPNKQLQLYETTMHLNYKAKLVSVLNFATTDIAEKIKQGGIVSVNDEHTNYFYKRIAKTDNVLVLAFPSELNSRSEFYVVFILLFYIENWKCQ